MSEAAFHLAAKPAVRVTGRLVSETGEPIKGFAVFEGTHSLARTLPDGTFTCVGVPKLEPRRFVYGAGVAQVWVRDFTAQQLATNSDIGDVTIAPAAKTAMTRLRASTLAGPFDQQFNDISNGITLVRSDGSVIYSLRLNPETKVAGPATAALDPDHVMALAPGQFYISPGGIGSSYSMKLLTIVRANRHAELDASDAPKFTAVEGQTVNFTFDLAAAKAVIEAILGVATGNRGTVRRRAKHRARIQSEK